MDGMVIGSYRPPESMVQRWPGESRGTMACVREIFCTNQSNAPLKLLPDTWRLKNLRFENKNPEKKVRNKIKVQRKKFSIFFTDFTSQFIVHILGFALNWCHSHGDILWFCLWSPAHVSFPPTMNSVCLR